MDRGFMHCLKMIERLEGEDEPAEEQNQSIGFRKVAVFEMKF